MLASHSPSPPNRGVTYHPKNMPSQERAPEACCWNGNGDEGTRGVVILLWGQNSAKRRAQPTDIAR